MIKAISICKLVRKAPKYRLKSIVKLINFDIMLMMDKSLLIHVVKWTNITVKTIRYLKSISKYLRKPTLKNKKKNNSSKT